jgi:hypothetical protein
VQSARTAIASASRQRIDVVSQRGRPRHSDRRLSHGPAKGTKRAESRTLPMRAGGMDPSAAGLLIDLNQNDRPTQPKV